MNGEDVHQQPPVRDPTSRRVQLAAMAVTAEPILASPLWRPAQTPSGAPQSPRKLRTGHHSIDAALEGGLEYGTICCISAEAKSGAGDITHAMLVSHLLDDPISTATVIDTTLSFDLRGLHSKLVRRLQARGEGISKAMAILERLKIMKVFDFVGLTESTTEIREALERGGKLQSSQLAPPRGTVGDSEDEDLLDVASPPREPTSPVQPGDSTNLAVPGLVIIDSLTHVAAPVIKSNHIQGQALLTSFIRSLAHLARTHNLGVLLINTATTYAQALEDPPSIFASCALHPALGKTFAFLLDTHLLVHSVPKTPADTRVVSGGKQDVGSRRGGEVVEVVEVLQDRSAGRVGMWAAFGIDAQGDVAEV
ncbi:hypothetical protein LTR53_014260 [Teratosphaeriaceae sp. CCFEE 6253]|nr:hypothetical protein LTR53_014260 [Teratosphaeriaceae sp. CCFEE 6253]